MDEHNNIVTLDVSAIGDYDELQRKYDQNQKQVRPFPLFDFPDFP
jgi:hypothetical protein